MLLLFAFNIFNSDKEIAMGWGELNGRFREALVEFLEVNGGQASFDAVARILGDEGLVYVTPSYVIQLAEQDGLVVYDRNLQIVILK